MLNSEIVARGGRSERHQRIGGRSSVSHRGCAGDSHDSIRRPERASQLEISQRQHKTRARGGGHPPMNHDEQQAIKDVQNAVAGLNEALAKAAGLHIEIDLSSSSMATVNSRAKYTCYSGSFTWFSQHHQVRGVIE